MTSGPVDLADVYRRFLIECLNSRRAPDALQTAAELVSQHDFDWEVLGSIIAAERIGPLLYHITRRQSLIPPELSERCHAAYLESGAQNTLRLRELSAVLTELTQAGISVILLKGAALIEPAYGNIALRPMTDLDLLVPKQDVSQAITVLEGYGYRQESREIAPGAALDYENEILLHKLEQTDFYLELHWSLFNSPFYQDRLPIDRLWESAAQVWIQDTPALCLSPEWMLIHLCGHLALHHYGTGLIWWNDVAELINHYTSMLDWAELIQLAIASSLVLPLKKIIPAVERNWRAKVPHEVLDHLAGLSPTQAESRIYEILIVGDAPPGQRMLVDTRGMTSWPQRVRFLYRNLVPTADYMDARYQVRHPSLRVLYYLRRWVLGAADVLRYRVQRRIKREGK